MRSTETAEQTRQTSTSTGLRQSATRVRSNLWLVPPVWEYGIPIFMTSVHGHMCDLRREFEYSVVEGPPAGESDEGTAMAQLADGIILVLSARYTRRATARKIKEALDAAQTYILGTVLIDRVFPIPEKIYRRL